MKGVGGGRQLAAFGSLGELRQTLHSKGIGIEYTYDESRGTVGLIAFQIPRVASLTGTLQTHKGTHDTCKNPRGGWVGGRKGGRRREGEGWGGERAAAASGPSRTRGPRAGTGLQVSQLMASENLNKEGRRRRAAAAQSCSGGFPRSLAKELCARQAFLSHLPQDGDGGPRVKGRGNFETSGDTSVYRY